MDKLFYLLAFAAALIVVAIAAYWFARKQGPARKEAKETAPSKTPEAHMEEIPEFEEPPGWAASFTTPEWTFFMREIRSTLKTRNIPFTIQGTGVILAQTPGGEKQLGLLNLAQTCKQVKQPDWPGIIQRHFDHLLKTEQEHKDLEGKIKDFAQIKPMLVVRLAPQGTLPRDLLVAREDLPGTVSYLALDLPTSIRSLKPDEVAVWGRPVVELFETALENVARMARPQISTPQLEDGITCTALVGESFFVATHALLLDLYPQCLGAQGSLVAVPHRHCVLAYPIEDLSVIKAIPRLALIGRKLEAEGPGSISPQLFWYHHGSFILLPYEIKENTFNFAPPEDFLAVLNEMGES